MTFVPLLFWYYFNLTCQSKLSVSMPPPFSELIPEEEAV